MRLYASAVSLFVLGLASGTPDAPDARWEVLHTEVAGLMAPSACPITVFLAQEYLAPTIAGAERVAFECHANITAVELARLHVQAAMDNASEEPKLVRLQVSGARE
jgi:hypothetical protein